MSYVLSCGLFRRRKHPGAPPLVRVNMGAAFPVIFAFFPASQSAGQHETRSCALDDAQNGPGHMAQQCPVCCINCADPPSRWQRASLLQLVVMQVCSRWARGPGQRPLTDTAGPQLPEVCRLMTWVRSCQATGNNNPGTSFSAIAKKLKLICGNCRAG